MLNFREVHRTFRERFDNDPVAAHIYLARFYLSVAETYRKWWQWPVARWHFRQASSNIENALYLDEDNFKKLTSEEVREVGSILANVPRWLVGGCVAAWRA